MNLIAIIAIIVLAYILDFLIKRYVKLSMVLTTLIHVTLIVDFNGEKIKSIPFRYHQVGRIVKTTYKTVYHDGKFDKEKIKEDLRPDYCHYGNLFYDKNIGFSFIDVYPVRDITHYSLPVNQIFNIIVNPKFTMRTKSGSLSVLPQELKEDYNIYMSDICKKILTGLYQYGYPQEEIKKFIDSKCYSFTETDCLNQEELQHKIEEMNKVKDFCLYEEL